MLKVLRSPAVEVLLVLFNSIIFNLRGGIFSLPIQTAISFYHSGANVPKKHTSGNTENNKPFGS